MYLKEGSLQPYLEGLTSAEEKQEAEHLLATDPELLADLDELEDQLEDFFLRNAVPPPPAVREGLLQRISEREIQPWQEPEPTHGRRRTPEPDGEGPNYVAVEVDNTHIRVHKYWRTAFIAVFILSKVFLILGLYYYFKSNSQEQEIERLKAGSGLAAPHLRVIPR